MYRRPQSTFAAAFSGTMGALFAVFAIFVLLPCGGLLFFSVNGSVATAKREIEQRQLLRKQVLTVVAPHGIRSLAEEAEMQTDGRDRSFIGEGLDRKGNKRQVTVVFRVSTFEKETVWEVQHASIDGVKIDVD